MDKDLAIRIIEAGLGKAELEMVTSFTTPIFWGRRTDIGVRVTNGSAFFLNAGKGVFGVTAAHDVAKWREDREKREAGPVRLAGLHSLIIDLDNRLIDEHPEIDIATFRISSEEVASLEKIILTGSQRSWPPQPPQRDRGVLLGGYPGCGTMVLKPDEVSFGAAPAGLIAHSVSELDVSCMLERQELLDVLGKGRLPQHFDFGGMSGGPMLTIVEKSGIRSWALAGVIYQGPNPSETEDAIDGLEIIKARRAHFIGIDGTLDRERWAFANPR